MIIKIMRITVRYVKITIQVMLAASYWSLLAPAIEMAEMSGYYGEGGKFTFIPVSVGFILGAVFVFGADKVLPHLVLLSAL